MTKKQVVMSLGAAVLFTAGALAGRARLTSSTLYFTTGTGATHCHQFSSNNSNSAFVTSPTGTTQAQIITSSANPTQKLVFATSSCTKAVYFKP